MVVHCKGKSPSHAIMALGERKKGKKNSFKPISNFQKKSLVQIFICIKQKCHYI
jgi:hypothetical protein